MSTLSRLQADIASPRLLAIKGLLFALLGVLCTAIVAAALRGPLDWRLGLAAHALALWAFCRAYYFAFYVLTAYADPSYRYAGLCSAARKSVELMRKR